MLLKISRYALDVIKRESINFPTKETGGILIGYKKQDRCIVPYATGSGQNALKEAAAYNIDVNTQQKVLDEITEKYPFLGYIGTWHKHPGRMSRPSGVDRNQALEILEDENYTEDEGLVMPIVTLGPEDPQFYPYYISRENQKFKALEFEITPHSDEKDLAKKLQQVRVKKNKVKPSGVNNFFKENFNWFETEFGKKRLKEEIKELKAARLETEIKLIEDEERELYIFVRRGADELKFRMPRAYPLTKPRIYRNCGADFEEVTGLKILADGWSDTIRLIEITQELFGNIDKIREKHSNKRENDEEMSLPNFLEKEKHKENQTSANDSGKTGKMAGLVDYFQNSG